jgi:biopolymer transport protein ExbD
MAMRRKPTTVKLPQVNLIPMLDVLMSVLTFFVIITMSFSGPVIQDVQTPQASHSDGEPVTHGPLVLGVNARGEMIYDGKPITADSLKETVRQYLAQNPQGQIIFKADRRLPYRQIATVLAHLADAGGDQISFTITP